jgi:hypothetical protein
MEHEQYRPKRIEDVLENIQILSYPSIQRNRAEWLEEILQGKFHTGKVIGVTLDKENPKYCIVFYDAGRRRKTINDQNGIVLEGVRWPTKGVLKLGIKKDDLVETNWWMTKLTNLGSSAEIERRGIVIPKSIHQGGTIVGALIF